MSPLRRTVGDRSRDAMKRSLAALALLASLLVPPTSGATAQVSASGGTPPVFLTDEGIGINFQDTDLADVLAMLAQQAGLNVIYSNMPKVTVTVMTVTPVPKDGLVKIIEDLARVNGVEVAMDQETGFLHLRGQGDDIPPEPRTLYIYRLKHARAPELAETLQSLFGAVGLSSGTSGGSASSELSAQIQMLSLQQQALRFQQRQAAAQERARSQGQGSSPSGASITIGGIGGTVTIVPHEPSNSLLFYATEKDWEIIEKAMMALDLRPLQVMIEVLVAEVRRTDDLDLGASFTVRNKDDDGEGGGGTDRTTRADGSVGTDGSLTLSILRTGRIDIEATLTALASTGNVRILSRPIVVAQNNQEANFLVGSERPFVSTSTTVPAGQIATVQNIQYRDIGTELTITPTINEEGYVNLTVEQSVKAATSEVQFDAPVISTREATTQVFVRDGQTVVIGGLVDRQEDKTRSGIPFLKDIPILGYLFSSTRETTITSELFLFLTPYIVETDQDAEELRRELERRLKLLEDIVPPPLKKGKVPPDTTSGGEGGDR